MVYFFYWNIVPFCLQIIQFLESWTRFLLRIKRLFFNIHKNRFRHYYNPPFLFKFVNHILHFINYCSKLTKFSFKKLRFYFLLFAPYWILKWQIMPLVFLSFSPPWSPVSPPMFSSPHSKVTPPNCPTRVLSGSTHFQ